jgi:hypothetical protein
MCRRWSAGPFLGIQCGASVKVESEAALATFRSSEWAIRQFCKECGTPLFYRLVDFPDHCVVSVEAFDDGPAFHFDLQIFIDEKPGHYDFSNSTITQTGAQVFAAFQAGNGSGQNG